MRLALLAVLPVAAVLAAAPARGAEGAKERVIKMEVTDDGFVPADVKVKAGEAIKLVITRKTARTCATEITIPDYGIKVDLPLDKAVEVAFTAKKAGKVKYGCAMGMMIGGVLVVE